MRKEGLIFTRRNLLLLVIALVLLVYAVSLKHPFLVHGADDSVSLDLDSISSFVKEVSFALLIGLVIAVGLEHQARKSDLESAEAMRRVIAEDVFKGVFSSELPRSYIDAVIDQNMRVDIIRTYVRLYDRVLPAEGMPSVLQYHRRHCYVLKNVSTKEQNTNVECFIPCDANVSRGASKVVALKIRKETYADDAISEGLKASSTADELVYAWPIKIGPADEVYVELETVFLKAIVDSEVWSTLYPTMRLNYSIRFDVPVKRFGVAGRSATPLVQTFKDDAGGFGDWEINGPMLVNNSLTIWWECQAGDA